jgi:hypothetical protein
MNNDKRTVTTDALETLGSIITPNEKRDAIHLAVENVVAAHDLRAGEHVGFVEGGVGTCDNPVGIVDPFLTVPVTKGSRFWLVVYPRQITSLRHVWTHPAFPESEVEAPASVSPKEVSEKWMREWAMKHMSADYYGDETSLNADVAYDNAMRAGSDNHIGPYEDARDHIDNEWWSHWETITGKQGNRGEYFSCAC